jgi:hypothetical protein
VLEAKLTKRDVARAIRALLPPQEGKPITANQYLERAWTSAEVLVQTDAGLVVNSTDGGGNTATSATVDSKADLRRCYAERSCLLMPQPTNNNKLLAMVNAMPVSQMAPEFVTALEEFRSMAFKMLAPKRLEGVAINGASLVEYIRSALPAINDGTIPLVEDSVQVRGNMCCARLQAG